MTPRPRHSPTLPLPSRTIAAAVMLLAIASVLLLGAPAGASTRRRSHPAVHRNTVKRCPATKRLSTSRSARAARRQAHGARTVKSCVPRRTHSGRGSNTGGVPGNWRPVVSSPLAPGSSEAHAEETPARPRRKGSPGTGLGGLPQEEGDVLTDPIDSRFLTKDPFGASSFWIQPWRAYLDTWPSSTLLKSLGINFNVGVAQAEPVAQLLQDSGFTLARREIPWGALSYEDPSEFNNEPKIATILGALHNHGLRPLILLNANSGQPGPAKPITLTTLATAYPGAMTVHLDQASAAEIVPGKTGFDELTWGTGPDVLVTAVDSEGVASLSRPLRVALPAGKHRAMTLRYAPFQNPKLPNGEPNPIFQETLQGWLGYVATVNREATKVFGPGGYDLEVWNELTFGSQFLNSEHYYQPSDARTIEAEARAEAQDEPLAPEDAEAEASPETRADSQTLEGLEEEDAPEAAEAEEEEPEGEATGAAAAARPFAGEPSEEGPERKDLTKAIINDKVTKAVTRTLLKETVAFVRNPANGISAGVGISDGFASQTPFPSGALAPLGMTALSKHLYNGAKQFPAAYREKRIKPLDAFGFRDTEGGRGFKPLFVPEFQSLFPEYFLTALPTETLVRDIAPITTEIYGLKHGREVGPAGGAPVQKWMTEYNLSQGKGKVMQADGVTPAGVTETAADRAHFEAKALLRSLVANVNKGLSREYFFAAAPGALSLIGKSFYSELEAHPETYPGDALGGETMSGFRNMLDQFSGPGPEGQARQLKLLSIAQEGNHAQFNGDGTAAHPTLYDRDVLAVLPFQSSPTHFVVPVYVMTRDLLTLYEPGKPSSDVTRFDLPDENFTIRLGNLPETSEAPTVSAYDPLRETSTPAQLISREGSTAEFRIAATDYPRMLSIDYH